MPLGTALSVASTAAGAIKGTVDYFKERAVQKKAEEELSRLKQPFYKIQDEYTQNRNISANNIGLPEETKNYYTTEAQRGVGAGISAINQGGGSPNDLSGLFSAYDNSLNKVAANDAASRVQGIQNFMQANKELAGQKTMKWSLDEYQPWQRKLKEITERIAASKVNQNNALNTAIGVTSSAGTALSNNDLMNQLFPAQPAATGAGTMTPMVVNPQTQGYGTPQGTGGINPAIVPNIGQFNTNTNFALNG